VLTKGAFGALEKICEDSAGDIDYAHPQLAATLLQHILQHINNPNEVIRACALKCTNQFLCIRSNAIWDHFDEFLQMLYKLTNDPGIKMKRYVCQAFNHVVELDSNALIPVLESVVDFMLVHTQNEDKELALEAGDFWIVVTEDTSLHVHLQPYLHKIVPVLLKCMIYTDEDLFILEEAAEENAHIADKDQDIKPRFHKSKVHEVDPGQKPLNEDSEEEDEDFDMEDYDDEWNVRKCCAAALDTLSTIYDADILPHLLPTINQMMSQPAWETQEAAILAIGAVANGKFDLNLGASVGMQQHLPALIPHLLQYLRHEKPLVRSITCWTLGRYCSWMTSPPHHIGHDLGSLEAHRNQYMVPFLQLLLTLCLDNNKEVQKAACSALATLEEEARQNLIPYLNHIVDTLAIAFSKYQVYNVLTIEKEFDGFV
jgi:transportin-1